MGDFNVCCSISGISIDGGCAVAYIPLEVSDYTNKIGDGNNILIYRHCFYSPVTLPIFGEYDSYGGVENIEKDDNVEVVETYFKRDIKDIISLIKMKKPVSSGMFIHREVFNFLMTNLVDEWGKTKNSIEYNFGNNLSNLLEKHQKSLVKNVENRKRNIKLWEGFPQTKETEEHIKYYKSRKYWDWVCNDSSVFLFRDYKKFNYIYQPQILKGGMQKELTDFILFEMGMYSVNRFYFPAMNGQQYGNKYASRNLYRACLKIMNGDIKTVKEWHSQNCQEATLTR